MAVRQEELTTFDPYLQLPGVVYTDELYLKVEHLNTAGSVKMKAARYLISYAEKKHGDLSGRLIIESSSGNLGIALAMICAARKCKFRCVVDPNSNVAAIAEMQAYGAEIHRVCDRDENGGYLGTRFAAIDQIIATDSTAIWLNQYQNPSNPSAHSAGPQSICVVGPPAEGYSYYNHYIPSPAVPSRAHRELDVILMKLVGSVQPRVAVEL